MLPHQTNSSKLINQPTESEHSAGIQENILTSKQLFKFILLYLSLSTPSCSYLSRKIQSLEISLDQIMQTVKLSTQLTKKYIPRTFCKHSLKL